jgi:hypothetical protein
METGTGGTRREGTAEVFRCGLSLLRVLRLYQEIGHDYLELQRRTIALKIKRTRHLAKKMRPLEKRMYEIGRDVEFGTIYSKLFTETGELKYFVSVAGLAKRTGVSPSAVRRRIAKGELSAVKGFGGYYIDTRKLSPTARRDNSAGRLGADAGPP